MRASLLDRLAVRHPIIQAPMAGVSTPAMAAAVSNSGALGSLGVGAQNAAGALGMIDAARGMTQGPLNVNVFCHRPARSNPSVEHEWSALLAPEFVRYGALPPSPLTEIYKSFLIDADMLQMLLECRPAMLSCHFGLPTAVQIEALRAAGIVLVGSATNLAEARQIEAAGFDAVIAQGTEAGGHRGVFDPHAPDAGLTTLALTRILVRSLRTPVIAAGGIMNGAGIAAVLRLGAIAAQLGTAFIDCPESAADAPYRAALKSDAAHHTTITSVISGRPARCLANRFTQLARHVEGRAVPDYPIAYHAGKALNEAARSQGETGYGAQWAGQGAPLARSLPAARLIEVLLAESAADSVPG